MPEAPVIQQQIQKLDERSADVSKQIAVVNEQMGSNAIAREAATEPLLKGVEQAQGDAAQFIERRQAGRPVIPEFKPQPPVDAKEFQGLSYALIGMAMIGGAVSKGNWLGVADTLNGAMKGFIDGNKALADKNVKDYEQQFKVAAAKEQQWVRETEDVLKAKNLSINQKLTQIRIVAAQYDKQDMLAQGRLKSLEGVQRALDSQKTTLTGLQQRHEDNMARIDSQNERHAESLAQRREAQMQREDASQIPPETLNFMARQALKGDTSVFQNIGRGAQGSRNIGLLRNEMQRIAKDEGISPEELAVRNAEYFGVKAGERTLGTRTANMGMAVNEANQMADLVTQASAKVPRTRFQPANKAIVAYEKNTGDTSVREFGAALNSFINAYARAISPTGVSTVNDKEHAREMLSTADSHDQVKAIIGQLRKEMEAARKAPGATRQEFRDAVMGNKPEAAPAVPGVDPSVQQKVEKMTPEQRQKRIQELKAKQSSASDVIDFSELAA